MRKERTKFALYLNIIGVDVLIKCVFRFVVVGTDVNAGLRNWQDIGVTVLGFNTHR